MQNASRDLGDDRTHNTKYDRYSETTSPRALTGKDSCSRMRWECQYTVTSSLVLCDTVEHPPGLCSKAAQTKGGTAVLYPVEFTPF